MVTCVDFLYFGLLTPGLASLKNRQKFTIYLEIYVINGLVGGKKFTNARMFTIDQFTITRFDCVAF